MIPFHLPGDLELHGSFPFTLKIHELNDDVPPHTHSFIEYTYVISGSATEIVNGTPRPLEVGTFTLLLPHQVHQIRIPKGTELRLYVGAIGLQALFAPDDTSAAFHELLLRAGASGEPSYALEESLASRIHAILAYMYEEIRSDRQRSRLMFKAKLTEALILIERSCFPLPDEGPAGATFNRKGKMREIVQYVYEHYREDINLSSLSEKFQLSVPHISSSFKRFIGDNFHSFLEKIRISHACSLLTAGNETVTAICFEVGFVSYPTFARVFQSRLGMSPIAYRKLNRRVPE
ncbi:AraC family transcriptional regulator [Cohnella fermenti]|uniref:Helix-turn-helix domain-containing protein n=1 Tax=Cohnella fermenti TaxID=2565925 RepID=A0A4S4C7K7_9BACL|nr:AraC family transcriptional regulator [Cohnella fermenti]THF83269.1 helix-turn-helix domain-containing protein [Cohnella fermenti]